MNLHGIELVTFDKVLSNTENTLTFDVLFSFSYPADTSLSYDAQPGKKTLMPYVNSEGLNVGTYPCNLYWTFSVC